MSPKTLTPRPEKCGFLELDGERPLTTNKVMGLHRMAWATITRDIREAWWLLAVTTKPPRLQQARIIVTPLHADRRSPQDVAACAPHAKAAIDGLIDYGLLPDDDASHLVEITFRPPLVCGRNGLRIEFEEVSGRLAEVSR